LVDVIREKRGDKDRDDLSDNEVVQMGLKMQSTIGRIFEDETSIKVRDLDLAGTHPTESWLRAHGDFETGDGGLLEVKNYNAAAITKYSEPDETVRLPEADYIQCVHEATVFCKPHVWFAVLFGGQRFRYWRIDVPDDIKLEFIQRAAKWWAMSQSGNIPEPETVDQARYAWQRDNGDYITATAQVESVIAKLSSVKQQIKLLEENEQNLTLMIQKYMQSHSEIRAIDGRTLVTWKEAKAAKKFSARLFEQAMPDLYNSFKVEMPSGRRFLVK
jgi:predicted phage-related endonuclease